MNGHEQRRLVEVAVEPLVVQRALRECLAQLQRQLGQVEAALVRVLPVGDVAGRKAALQVRGRRGMHIFQLEGHVDRERQLRAVLLDVAADDEHRRRLAEAHLHFFLRRRQNTQIAAFSVRVLRRNLQSNGWNKEPPPSRAIWSGRS